MLKFLKVILRQITPTEHLLAAEELYRAVKPELTKMEKMDLSLNKKDYTLPHRNTQLFLNLTTLTQSRTNMLNLRDMKTGSIKDNHTSKSNEWSIRVLSMGKARLLLKFQLKAPIINKPSIRITSKSTIIRANIVKLSVLIPSIKPQTNIVKFFIPTPSTDKL